MNKLNQKGREGHDGGSEGHSLGLGGLDVCVGYILSSISVSPSSVLTKPVAGGQRVVKRKTGVLPMGLLGAVPGRRKTERKGTRDRKK